ncbi:hypothetical protein KFU94_50120 [Chloroflexi bacterium TSY]|nr:hypothetical protein [Chloroflexi bacterium TSY]
MSYYTEQDVVQSIENKLSHYSPQEVDYLLKKAWKQAYHLGQEHERVRHAFYTFLELIGLGPIAVTIRAARWGWSKIRRFWDWLTG